MSETDDALIVALRGKAASSRPTDRGTPKDHRPPASSEAVARAEADLGFRLDPFLRRVYADVSDGGIGPGYGAGPALGRTNPDLSSTSTFCSNGWPEKLLPAWDWGDAIWSCVDGGDPGGHIVTHDDAVGSTLTNFTTRSWLQAWVDGVDLWDELYEDKEATIVNPFTRKPVATKVRGTARGRPWPIR